jgi:hypothetical protein
MSKASEFLEADGWERIEWYEPRQTLWRDPVDQRVMSTSEAIDVWRKRRWPLFEITPSVIRDVGGKRR